MLSRSYKLNFLKHKEAHFPCTATSLWSGQSRHQLTDWLTRLYQGQMHTTLLELKQYGIIAPQWLLTGATDI